MNNPRQDLVEKPPVRSVPQRIRSGLREYVSELRLFSRNAKLYLLGLFLIWINFQVFMLLFNLYLKELGFVEGDIGLINSSRAIGMTLVAIPAAWLLSRIRLKPVLVVGAGLLAVFSFGMSTVSSFFVIFGFSVLSGMTLAFFRVAAGPFFMRNSTPKERTLLFSASFAVHVLAGMMAAGGGGETAGWLGHLVSDEVLGYRYTLYIGIAVSTLGLLPFSLIKASDPSKEESRLELSWSRIRARGKFYFKISVGNFLVGLGAGLVIPFLNLYFRDRFDLAPDTIGWFYFAVSFSMFVSVLTGPVLAKRLGLVRTVIVTQLLSIPFMFILAYSYILPLVVVAFIVRGGLMNMGVPLVNNFSMELSEKNEQGLVNALLMLTWTGSWMVSTAVGGSLIEAYGYTVTINTAIILYLLSTAIYYFMFRHAETRDENGRGYRIVTENTV